MSHLVGASGSNVSVVGYSTTTDCKLIPLSSERNVSVRYYHAVAALNNLGISRLKAGRLDDAISCFELSNFAIHQAETMLATSNDDTVLLELFYLLRMEIQLQRLTNQVVSPANCHDGDCATFCGAHIPRPLNFSISFADMDEMRSIRTLSNVTRSNDNLPIFSPGIYVDSSELNCSSDEFGFLSVITLYNLALAIWMKSFQLEKERGPIAMFSHECNLIGGYKARSRQLFQDLLRIIELRVSRLVGGDTQFFLAISVSMLIVNCLAQISYEQNDSQAGSDYTISINNSYTILNMWYYAAESFWGSNFKRNLAGAA